MPPPKSSLERFVHKFGEADGHERFERHCDWVAARERTTGVECPKGLQQALSVRFDPQPTLVIRAKYCSEEFAAHVSDRVADLMDALVARSEIVHDGTVVVLIDMADFSMFVNLCPQAIRCAVDTVQTQYPLRIEKAQIQNGGVTWTLLWNAVSHLLPDTARNIEMVNS